MSSVGTTYQRLLWTLASLRFIIATGIFIHGVRIRNYSSEQLEALDKLLELVDEADILIRAGKLRAAKAKIHAAEEKASLIRNPPPKRKVASV